MGLLMALLSLIVTTMFGSYKLSQCSDATCAELNRVDK